MNEEQIKAMMRKIEGKIDSINSDGSLSDKQKQEKIDELMSNTPKLQTELPEID